MESWEMHNLKGRQRMISIKRKLEETKHKREKGIKESKL